jgi:hypothetical protein
MRKLRLCSAGVLLLASSNAFALTAALKNSVGGGTTVLVSSGSASTLDLLIELNRTGDPTLAGVQMDFIADAPGLTIIGTVPTNNRTSAGTGTRYNTPEWDGSTTGSLNPDDFDGPMPANTSVGTYGTGYVGDGSSVWSTPTSIMGHLIVQIAPLPGGTVIHLTPTTVLGVDSTTFDNVEGVGQAFTFLVPEPTSALLLLAALPFMRRRTA